VSEDLDELFEICDRLLVICQGRVSPPLIRKTTDREEVGLLMTGRTMSTDQMAIGSGDVALQD
ncbi:ABC transporter ATP-binding protein, partial [Mesorhizobium sp. M7A.F.Ca.CA.001.12.2.1]